MREVIASVLIAPKPGIDTDELEAVFAELVKGVRTKDQGVPGYGYFRGEDGRYRVIERYESSETYLAHLENMDESVVEHLVALADFPEVEILGDPSPEVRKAVEVFGARYRSPVVAIGMRPS